MTILLGYYGVLGRLVVPSLLGSLDPFRAATAVRSIDRHALPLVVLAAILLVATGTYLLVASDAYTGLGDFGSTWARLILLKHLVVVALAGGAVLTSYLAATAGDIDDREVTTRRLRQVGWVADGTLLLGVVVVVLTAAAQVSA